MSWLKKHLKWILLAIVVIILVVITVLSFCTAAPLWAGLTGGSTFWSFFASYFSAYMSAGVGFMGVTWSNVTWFALSTGLGLIIADYCSDAPQSKTTAKGSKSTESKRDKESAMYDEDSLLSSGMSITEDTGMPDTADAGRDVSSRINDIDGIDGYEDAWGHGDQDGWHPNGSASSGRTGAAALGIIGVMAGLLIINDMGEQPNGNRNEQT